MILQDAHVLVIAPHADDETIGLGGFIAKALKEFHCKINVAILTESEPNRNVEMEDALRILEAPSHQGTTFVHTFCGCGHPQFVQSIGHGMVA